jgi:hypothetical protein
MAGNWVAPHDLASESPVTGTVWNDIDFGGAAQSASWRGAGAPMFVNIGLGSNPDYVDYEEYLVASGLTNDFVMGVAVTYVENTTGSPLPVGLCTASDDSVQVWVNGVMAVNLSVCRGTAADCSEVTPAVLAPGVNRITVLVWEGFGGFGFRFGFTKPDGSKYTDLDPEIVYLGAASAAGAPGALPHLERTHEGSDHFCPSNIHRVSLTGSGGFGAGTVYTVEEDLEGFVSIPNVTNISNAGTAADLPPPPPLPPRPVGEFADHRLVGTAVACGPSSDTVYDSVSGIYSSFSETGGDIWEGGDLFEFAYSRVEGDFDLSITFTDRLHSNGQGRWGKFGLMARRSLTDVARYTFLHDNLPDLQDAARLAGRLVHNVPPPTGNMYEDVVPGGVSAHPLCFRLTRRGNVFEGWASDNVGLANGSLDPEEDANWVKVGRSDDWGVDAPTHAFVGFANSEHNSNGCAVQTASFRILSFGHTPDGFADTEPIGVKITWNVTGAVLDSSGVGYDVTAPTGTSLQVSGRAGGAGTTGPAALYFQAAPSGGVGAFDGAHDIGLGGPCSPGSLTVDDQGTADELDDAYTMTASGLDIWAGGDQFHFGYNLVSGDFTAQARFFNPIHPVSGGRWGKFGLMARWDCRPNSAYFFAHNSGASNFLCEIDGPRTAYRPYGGDNGQNGEPNGLWWQDVFQDEIFDPSCYPLVPDVRANDTRGDERNLAPWLRLVRRGSTFYGYASDDGQDWRILGSFSWPEAPETILVGAAMTSHAGCNVQTISFDNLEIGLPPEIQADTDPGAGPDDLDGTVILSADFEADADGDCPAGWDCNRWGTGAFSAQAAGGRLRLGDMRQSILGTGEDTATDVFHEDPIDLASAYVFDFDVMFRYDQAAAGDNNPPADGLTFTVLGTADLEQAPGATPPVGVGEFTRRTVGPPCSPDNNTVLNGGTYTTRSTTGRDIWASGDAFEFAYKHVEGDFDMSVELIAKRFPAGGRWGKFGLMARQDLTFSSRFSALQDHGPLIPDNDTARFARRITHGVVTSMEEPAVTAGLTDPNDGSSLIHPRFIRLTRRGDLVQAWASNTAGDFDPANDANWSLLYTDGWIAPPERLYLGLHYSVHNSSGCNPGEVDWGLVHFTGIEVPEPPVPADPHALAMRLGDRGAGLGYNRINSSLNEGIIASRALSLNSFAIEIDNWHNGQVFNDGDGGNVSGWNPVGGALGTGTGAYHIALDVHASMFSAQRNHQVGVHDDDLPDVYLSGGINVRVLYDHGLVRAWVRQNDSDAWTKVIDYEIEPLEVNSREALVGFGASTGGATCIMEVDNLVVRRIGGSAVSFRRGDADTNGAVNITDAVRVLNVLFLGIGQITCSDAADSDDNGAVNITDAVRILNVLFLGIGQIPLPGISDCGGDPTDDGLDPCVYGADC